MPHVVLAVGRPLPFYPDKQGVGLHSEVTFPKSCIAPWILFKKLVGRDDQCRWLCQAVWMGTVLTDVFRLPVSWLNDNIFQSWRRSVKTITAIAANKLGKFLAKDFRRVFGPIDAAAHLL